MENKIITLEELCEILKVGRRTIDRQREKGLPCFKVGNQVRFDLEEVLNWLKEQSKNK
jgi:excisionase family DNA binding protein